ncbi:MAG TPA: glycosyltransferase family 1 protein [Polyangiaceae bacterium]|nr:glycosyltransferase family 1 protein [Polyangiaceae bacterium]
MAITRRLLLDLTPLDTPAGPRGIGRYIRELAEGLSALSDEELGGIEVVGLTSLSWSGEYQLTGDVASYRGNPALAAPTERDYYRWAYRQRFALWRAAQRAGVQAVHICDPHATPMFLGTTGCRRIVTCHDLVPTRFPERYFGPKDGGVFVGRQIEKRRYRSADLVVAISDATRDDVRSLLGVPEERVVRVHNGVDVERWASEPTLSRKAVLDRFGVTGRKFVLYVGGSDWRKNVEGMMAGLAHARAHGIDLDLVWAGHLQEGHIAGVDAEARKFGVSTSVRRLGFVKDDELAVLYRAARAHLLLSRCEGFGLTVVEAMAAGCPVVTTEGGALGEVAGDAALRVDPEDRTAIGEAIVRVCRDDDLHADLARRGRERAPRFSRHAQARAMARVYRDFFDGLA